MFSDVTLKLCDCGVDCLYLRLVFYSADLIYASNSSNLCYFVKIITMNKKCKNYKLQSLFSAIIRKPMENSYWVFVKGTWDVNVRVRPTKIRHYCKYFIYKRKGRVAKYGVPYLEFVLCI